MATTQFEATDARAAFPCFDEPEFKAQFIVTLVHQKDYKALSNMPVAKVISRDDGFMESHFKETVKMSTYLLAFIVCDFAYKESHTKRGNRVCMDDGLLKRGQDYETYTCLREGAYIQFLFVN